MHDEMDPSDRQSAIQAAPKNKKERAHCTASSCRANPIASATSLTGMVEYARHSSSAMASRVVTALSQSKNVNHLESVIVTYPSPLAHANEQLTLERFHKSLQQRRPVIIHCSKRCGQVPEPEKQPHHQVRSRFVPISDPLRLVSPLPQRLANGPDVPERFRRFFRLGLNASPQKPRVVQVAREQHEH